jgi:hypothetical protein
MRSPQILPLPRGLRHSKDTSPAYPAGPVLSSGAVGREIGDYRLSPGGILPPFQPRFLPWLQPGGKLARFQPWPCPMLKPDGDPRLLKPVLDPLKAGALN